MRKVRFSIVPDTAVLALGRVSNLAGVYMFFAMHAERDGTDARPSVQSCASFFGIQRRNVDRCLEWLVQHGLMVEIGLIENRIMSYRMVRNMALPDDMPLWSDMPLESGQQMPPESASACRSAAAQSDPLTRPEENHTRSRSVDPPQAAPRKEPGGGPGSEAGEQKKSIGPEHRAPWLPPPLPVAPRSPVVAHRSASLDAKPDPGRDAEDRDCANRLIEAGLFTEVGPAHRLAPALNLIRAYRDAQPRSNPLDWIIAVDLPQLTGHVEDRAAWIYAHLHGYGRERWRPENRDGSKRKFHAALLAGRLDEAISACAVEASYMPERLAARNAAAPLPASLAELGVLDSLNSPA